jgi:glycerophosphoryl diester phosphodiesterase
MKELLPLLICAQLLVSFVDHVHGVKRPIVIAHRGASGYLPEHTLESKVAAYFMQADYIEQDVVLTKDFKLLVLHDIYLDEVTNVADVFPDRKRINDSRFYAIDFTLDEIKTLKASERFRFTPPNAQIFPNRFPAGTSSFQLNTLSEEIELLQGLEGSLARFDNIYYRNARKVSKPGLYVEIKQPKFHRNEGKGNISEIVLDVLRNYNYSSKVDKVVVQCFDPAELERIRKELKANLTLVQLIASDMVPTWTNTEGLKLIKEFADGIGPEKDLLVEYNKQTKEVNPSQLFMNARKLNLFIHPFTFRIDQMPEYAKSYSDLMKIFVDDFQVDGLFADFPDVTVEYVTGRNSRALKLTLNVVVISACLLFKMVAHSNF